MARPFAPDKVPLPPDFRALPVDPALPLDVEIGCGVGFHPLRYAAAHPGRQVLAFERTKAKFEKFAGRLRHHPRLPNLIPVHGDAIPWITHGLGEASVDRYFLLYPNPYPKESQRNLRFPHMPFFSRLLFTMKPGATLTLATNEAFYAEEAALVFVQAWGLELEEKRVLAANEAPRTHFEKKYLARGQPCWNLVFRHLGKNG